MKIVSETDMNRANRTRITATNEDGFAMRHASRHAGQLSTCGDHTVARIGASSGKEA